MLRNRLIVSIAAAAAFQLAVLPALAADGKKKPMSSKVYKWSEMDVEKRPNGYRRSVFEGPTNALANLHCHISTLLPGEVSSEPRLHKKEEMIIVKEGHVEFHQDGVLERAGPGTVVYFAANAVTAIKNVGHVPATYTVVYYTSNEDADK